ncbi:MAG: sugar transferase [Bacteroidota bacterium]
MKTILCIGDFSNALQPCLPDWGSQLVYIGSGAQAVEYLEEATKMPEGLLFQLEASSVQDFMHLRYAMLQRLHLKNLPFVAISTYPTNQLKRVAKKFEVRAHFTTHKAFSKEWCKMIIQELNIQQSNPQATDTTTLTSFSEYHLPWWKRLFDIVVSGSLILLASPFLLLIALIIKLESRGPVFYVSKRAGQGFRIFDFYKFRSMKATADKELDTLKKSNEYKGEQAAEPTIEASDEQQLLVRDSGFVGEQTYHHEKQLEKAGTFVKIKNDPRVTRFGRFIRQTSIDELPQLFNVLKGDMSIVGNRPIPIYEAERLTTDSDVARFFAPAGITGLWQITKRRKEKVSEQERIMLDVEYAMGYNFWMDLHILWNTLPAALQSEKA